MQQAKSNKNIIWIVFAVVLVDMLGVGILIPIIPLLLTDPNYPYNIGLPVTQGLIILGFLTAIYPFGQFLATPILGQLSDRFGRKPVLAFSIAGTSISYVVFAIGIITHNIPLLFVSRALDGITGGNIAVAQASVADITTHENRAKSFGIIGAAFGIGFIIGPFLGGRLSDPSLVSWFDATTPFWFAAIVSAANMIAVLFYFKETISEKRHTPFALSQSFQNIKRAATDRTLRPLFITSFLFQSGFTFFTTFFGVYLISRFGFNQANIGDFFALVGICVAITQGVITGFAAKRWSSFAIVRVALFGVAATLLLFYLANVPWQIYLIVFPNAMFIGLIMANLTGLISKTGGANEQGEVLGINASVQALGQAIPPVIAGAIAATIAPSAPILFAAGIILISGFAFAYSCRPRKESTSTVS